ncbi:MAG: WD40/YVTN/BNR-like repeat-containing protein [Rudaea sp.]
MTANSIRRGMAIGAAVFALPLFAAPVPDLAQAMHWRLVGPFRGGWSTMAAGIPDRPNTFYFGAAGGGVWKTDDAGATWHSLGDRLPASSVGALAVAPSDSNVIYVGTGQVAARYDVAAGNGVYKSTDGGKTWTSAGLAATRHIGAILVDPKNANTVLVGALGHYFGPNAERGVFRSTDAGKTWKRTLFIDADTGVVDLATDPGNADIVYAAAWQVRNYPWLSYFQPNAGPGSGVYKSTDGGQTWKRLSGNGWPTVTLGRIGLATTVGGRVYAVINAAPNSGNVPHAAAHDEGGLYRSDHGGAHWQRVSGEGWLENDYFCRIAVDPSDRDRIYATGQSIRVSDDGGAHWHIFKGAPGGDDYHFVWINPKHPDHLITASDQGTVVSVDGGAHWSDWYNQPTGQFYHLAADNRFPYWIYSGQQDSGTVGIASRSDYGVLSFRDWHPVGGDERDYDVPDPQDANIVYGSGLGGRLSRWDARTGEVQNISPWPQSSYGERPTSVKYRYTWITPIAVSQLPPYPLYQGAQVLFRSLDKGASWQTISPDLSAKNANAKHCDGNLAAAAARACGYGVIFSIGLSPRDNNEIWIGTDDGTIQLTRDGGKHWQNVTPKSIPAWAKVASIDVSATQPGAAYAAIDNHRQDDFRPRALRTHDYGKTWTQIDSGFPANGFVDVVRADPVTVGLLYAGTDSGVFVSYDDGAHWQSLQRNLPTAWVRDLLVHDRDLIAATQGRAIWVLDDLTPLRQYAKLASNSDVLFDPAVAMRVRGSQNKDTPPPADTPLGENPPDGAIIDYHLVHSAHKVALQIRDSSGALVRSFASDAPEQWPEAERYFTKSWTQPPQQLSAAAGMHRFVWDLRLPRPRAVHHDYSIAAVFRDGTPIVPEGMLVAPGNYSVTLDVDGKTFTAPLKVEADPRVPLDASALDAALGFSREVNAALDRDYVAYGQVQAASEQLGKPGDNAHNAALHAAVAKYQAAIAPLQAGDESLDDIGSVLSAVVADVEGSDRAPTAPQRELVAATSARLQRAQARWEKVQHGELGALNAALKASGKSPIELPTPELVQLRDAPESKDLP